MAFGRKRNKQEAPQQQSASQSQASTPWQSHSGGSGYVVSELPYYDKGKRKIVVYTSDANGKIIKTFKK